MTRIDILRKHLMKAFAKVHVVPTHVEFATNDWLIQNISTVDAILAAMAECNEQTMVKTWKAASDSVKDCTSLTEEGWPGLEDEDYQTMYGFKFSDDDILEDRNLFFKENLPDLAEEEKYEEE